MRFTRAGTSSRAKADVRAEGAKVLARWRKTSGSGIVLAGRPTTSTRRSTTASPS